jgi:hypothetical protein
MKKNIFFILFIFVFISSGHTAGKVYIGMTNTSSTVLLEDNSYSRNENLWEQDEFGSIYQSYLEYIDNFLKRNFAVQDTNGEIIYNKYYSEFSKLTDIQIGKIFYVSTADGVFESKVTGYLFYPDDSFTSSHVFYVLLEVNNPKPFESRTPVIISENSNMSVLKQEENYSSGMYKTGIDIVKKNTLGRKFTGDNFEDGKETVKEFTEFSEEDFRLFKGKFTQTADYEYITNFSSRFSFMYYVNATYIINNESEIIIKIAEPNEKDFNYYVVKGIADIDNDGIDEILIDIGYYEGTGLYLYKFDGKEYEIIAEGFFAGV